MSEPEKKIELRHRAGSSPEGLRLLLKLAERRAEEDGDKSLERFVTRQRKALDEEG